MIEALVRDFLARVPVPEISARFHRTVAQVIVDACLRIRVKDGLNRVCLSGGTFQNLRLLGQAVEGLRGRAFEVFVHHHVPPNDGGLSLGQAVIANEVLISWLALPTALTNSAPPQPANLPFSSLT